MKKIHINFAHGDYFKIKQKLNTDSAIRLNCFDETIMYNESDIDKEFFLENSNIFKQNRGFGFWLWKPHLILKTLNRVEFGDIIFYTDSGSIFIKNISSLFDKVNKDKKGVLLFELNSNFTNKHVTKRDCFFYMNCDTEYFHNSIMTLASFILIKKTKFSLSFVNEWLEYCKDYRILTDSQNECGLNNLETFYDHRHDQSVLSLLARKYNVTLDIDPSQYGNDRRDVSEQLINHNR